MIQCILWFALSTIIGFNIFYEILGDSNRKLAESAAWMWQISLLIGKEKNAQDKDEKRRRKKNELECIHFNGVECNQIQI